MAADTVKARWVAGYHAILPDGTELVPGVTVIELGAAEAASSEHWEPVAKPAKAQAAE